ncbi:hypothetical protein PR048_017890 [Dryococelus australis]|uniref:Uncharacterized protein n=1 Tax=Dryococelus australis TaxID=614101 RepID=A0ABQ9HAW1_9NEOP|nr:hypothetical protein PR048_017890 [Dryococelus australis]
MHQLVSAAERLHVTTTKVEDYQSVYAMVLAALILEEPKTCNESQVGAWSKWLRQSFMCCVLYLCRRSLPGQVALFGFPGEARRARCCHFSQTTQRRSPSPLARPALPTNTPTAPRLFSFEQAVVFLSDLKNAMRTMRRRDILDVELKQGVGKVGSNLIRRFAILGAVYGGWRMDLRCYASRPLHVKPFPVGPHVQCSVLMETCNDPLPPSSSYNTFFLPSILFTQLPSLPFWAAPRRKRHASKGGKMAAARGRAIDRRELARAWHTGDFVDVPGPLSLPPAKCKGVGGEADTRTLWQHRVTPASDLCLPSHSCRRHASRALLSRHASFSSTHQGESGSVPGRFTLHMGIVPDDAAGRRVFSGISRFPLPFFPTPLCTHLISPSSALKISIKSRPELFSSTAKCFLFESDNVNVGARKHSVAELENCTPVLMSIRAGQIPYGKSQLPDLQTTFLASPMSFVPKPYVRCGLTPPAISRKVVLVRRPQYCSTISRRIYELTAPMRVKRGVEQRQNVRAGETGDPRENPPTGTIPTCDALIEILSVNRRDMAKSTDCLPLGSSHGTPAAVDPPGEEVLQRRERCMHIYGMKFVVKLTWHWSVRSLMPAYTPLTLLLHKTAS